jgi:hypothetical protein
MGIKSRSYAVLDFGRLGRLGRFGRADAVRVGVSHPLVKASAAKSANKFQQISRKSFASRRSLTAKSCRPIGNKKKPNLSREKFFILYRPYFVEVAVIF